MTEPFLTVVDWPTGLPPSTTAAPSWPNQPIQACMTFSPSSLLCGTLPP